MNKKIFSTIFNILKCCIVVMFPECKKRTTKILEISIVKQDDKIFRLNCHGKLESLKDILLQNKYMIRKYASPMVKVYVVELMMYISCAKARSSPLNVYFGKRIL